MSATFRRSFVVRAAAAALFLFPGAASQAGRSIRDSAHNLSTTGPSSIRALDEPQICIFCHGVHNTVPQTPLWNRESTGAVYTPYHSTTLKALVGQPTGASALCLSCHDGTVALGKVRSRSEEIRMSGSGLLGRRSNLGTDLSDDHPVSFSYDSTLIGRSGGELRDPMTFRPEVKLDHNRQLQCTTCHNAHDDTYGKFLVMDNRNSALCVVCHDKARWGSSSHSTSGASWNGNSPNPWPDISAKSVAEAGCENCHTPHRAGTPQRLLVRPGEEENCFVCHNGNVAPKTLVPEFGKLSRHDVRGFAGLHDPTEDILSARRHVECADCHNPHAANAAAGSDAELAGALAGVAGIGASGNRVSPATHEYEICFRCHADSGNKGEAAVPRDRPETNTRLEFNLANTSYHPVEGPGQNPDVPSLIPPLKSSSVIRCTDCHSNDEGPGAGGTGPAGPHGSIYPQILERKLELRDFSAEGADLYALCYKCHNRDSILANESFPFHRRHIVRGQTACTTCHDPHGVPGATHLINFNRTYVSANSLGLLTWTDEGRLQGSCNLSCHEVDHDNYGYAPIENFRSGSGAERR